MNEKVYQCGVCGVTSEWGCFSWIADSVKDRLPEGYQTSRECAAFVDLCEECSETYIRRNGVAGKGGN